MTASTGIFESLNQEKDITGIFNSLNNNEPLVNSEDSLTSAESSPVSTDIFNSPNNNESLVNSEDSSTSDESSTISKGTGIFESLNSGSGEVSSSFQATYNEPDLRFTESPENENFIFAKGGNFWKGFDEQKTDVQNWEIFFQSKYPTPSWHTKYSKPLPEGAGKLEIFSAQELYGYDDPKMPKWADMDEDARRFRIIELFNNNLDIKYPNRNDPDRERTKAETAGGLFAFLATPTSWLPIGRAYKTMIAIGAALGFEWGVAEGLADEGEINWKDVSIYTGIGAAAAPVLVLSGRAAVNRFKRFRLDGNDKRSLRAAQDLLDDYERMMYEAVHDGEKAADIPKLINEVLGISVAELRAAQKLTKRKTVIPTKKDVDDYYEIERYKADQNPIKPGESKLSWVEDMFGAISTRLRKYDERLLSRLREMDFNINVRTGNKTTEVIPFLKAFKKLNIKSKVSSTAKKDQQQITLALYNGDYEAAQSILKDAKLGDVQTVLNTLHKEAQEVGLNLGYLENYFPRELKHGKEGYPALIKYLRDTLGDKGKQEAFYINELMTAARNKKGKGSTLTAAERGDVINKYLLSPLKIGTGKDKGRTIDILSEDLLQFYKSPIDSLHGYISRVVTETERVKFFGSGWKGNSLKSGTNIDESIGSIIDDLIYRGKISGNAQIEEIKKILQARFTTGEQSPAAAIRRYKNLTNAAVLGNPVSALTQTGDIALSAWKVRSLLGSLNTLFTKSLNPFTKNKITLRDIHFTQVGEEFVSEGFSAAYMKAAFKYSLFRGIDRTGKETLMNQSLKNFYKQVSTEKGLTKFRKKWLPAFGRDNFIELVENLKKGNTENNQVRFLMWHVLNDMQPVSPTEMALKYLENPNGKIFYMLKTFTIKQFDIMRRDGIHLMKATKPARDLNQRAKREMENELGQRIGPETLVPDWAKRTEGLLNLLSFGSIFIGLGIGVDAVKDIIMGRKVDMESIEDSAIDKFWNLTLGFNKYGADKIASSSNIPMALRDALVKIISVPTKPLIDILDDAIKTGSYYVGIADENKATGKWVRALSMGNLAYAHLFGGKREYERKRRKRREGGEDIKQYRRGGLVAKNTYRRGGLVSHNGYRKNMSRLGFQEGGYAR